MFFGIFSLISLILNLNKEPVKETQMVINMFRHGARTPKHYIPEVEEIFKKYPIGALTDNGWRMQFLLGKYLRKRLSLLDPNFKFDASNILIISSYKDRTINSAISFGNGLVKGMFRLVSYDNEEKDIICKNKNFNWNIKDIIYKETNKYPPFKGFKTDYPKYDIMVVDPSTDILFHGRNCKFGKDVSYTLGKTKLKKFFSDITFYQQRLIFNYLKEEFKVSFDSIKDFKQLTHMDIKNIYLIIKSLEFEKSDKFVPNSPKNETAEAFYNLIYDYYYKTAISSDDQAKISSSIFFEKLITYFDNKISNKSQNYKIVSFSGHDYNILGLINNLYGRDFLKDLDKYAFKEFLFSSYSSSFEFHLIKKDEHEFFVKIFYNGHEPKFPISEIVYVKDYGFPYIKFKHFVNSKIFKNYNKCHIKSKTSKLKTMNFALRLYNDVISLKNIKYFN